MASFINEFSMFLDTEDLAVCVKTRNLFSELKDDLNYRTIILLLSIYIVGKGKDKKINIDILKMLQFIALNHNRKNELIEFVEKSKGELLLLKKHIGIPEGFRVDFLFDRLISFLYIQGIIAYSNPETIFLTSKGCELSEAYFETFTNHKQFEEELTVIFEAKALKITKGIIEKL